jgi:hypothetical protein
LSSEALERKARRQIPELSAKGYSLATRPGQLGDGVRPRRMVHLFR